MERFKNRYNNYHTISIYYVDVIDVAHTIFMKTRKDNLESLTDGLNIIMRN
jgi:hypothetical protein